MMTTYPHHRYAVEDTFRSNVANENPAVQVTYLLASELSVRSNEYEALEEKPCVVQELPSKTSITNCGD
jgi:hypothetical protein